MPSEESLRLQQYYAYPRNAFWPIVMTLLDQETDLEYAARVNLLINNHIALWDTLKSCVRAGSLDSSIVDSTVEANDFAWFYGNHPRIKSVFFNGKKSQQVYQKKVLPYLPEQVTELQYHVLPSSSPAMASLTRKQKIDQWRLIVEKLSEN